MGGVFSPDEGHIRGQRYVEALAHAAGRLGATLVQGAEVIGLEFQGRKVTGARTATETYYGGHTMLAAGPWTGIAGHWLRREIPVRPVKGQRILLRKAGFLPKCPVHNFSGYVIPWTDGNLMVAATREEGRFDQEPTADAVRQMISAAITGFPALRDAGFVSARAGVRPGTPDDIPILGPVPGWEGLSIASGHDRVGVILSAGSGEIMANYISTGDRLPLQPFQPGQIPVRGAAIGLGPGAVKMPPAVSALLLVFPAGTPGKLGFRPAWSSGHPGPLSLVRHPPSRLACILPKGPGCVADAVSITGIESGPFYCHPEPFD